MKPNLTLIAGIICLINVLVMHFIHTATIATITQNQLTSQATVVGDGKLTKSNVGMKIFPNLKLNEEVTKVSETSLVNVQPRARPEGPTMHSVKELTLSLPRHAKNKMGNWVNNPWGLTLGNVWKDTRFHYGGKVTEMTIHIDSLLRRAYYRKKGKLSTVCVGKSTVYNKPPIKRWLVPYVHPKPQPNRSIMQKLRRTIFIEANSEECHTVSYIKFRDFFECSIRRHQRCEYHIPNYPMHQRQRL